MTRCVNIAALESTNSHASRIRDMSLTPVLRLSYNTFRRGLFALNEEDYRWVHLRKGTGYYQFIPNVF
jgi:steroid 5-alpha reductase family enzyme